MFDHYLCCITLRLYRNSNVAELQCGVLVKRKTIPAHGGLCELHNIYQEKSHIELVVFVESYKNFDTTQN